MAIDVTTEIVIDRACADVAAYATDPGYAPRWYANIVAVTWRTPPPLAVGSKMDFVASFLGRRLAYTYEVTELDTGRRLVMGTSNSRFPMETTYEWTPIDATHTRMSLRNRGGPGGLARFADPLTAWSVRRSTSRDLAALKRILEAEAF
jgi:hypothetical protein